MTQIDQGTPLPLDEIEIAIGDKVDARTLHSGHYEFEDGYYRREFLRGRVAYYAKWKRDQGETGRICDGHKRVIRQQMALFDNPTEAVVSGVRLMTSQNENRIANQCYAGRHRGAGFTGCTVMATVMFRGEQPCDHRPGQINKVAINVTEIEWPQHRILAAKKALQQ